MLSSLRAYISSSLMHTFVFSVSFSSALYARVYRRLLPCRISVLRFKNVCAPRPLPIIQLFHLPQALYSPTLFLWNTSSVCDSYVMFIGFDPRRLAASYRNLCDSPTDRLETGARPVGRFPPLVRQLGSNAPMLAFNLCR